MLSDLRVLNPNPKYERDENDYQRVLRQALTVFLPPDSLQ
jgi:hypothetical protein